MQLNDKYVGHLDPATRMTVLKTLANNAGIRLPETFIPEGESLLPVGEEAKRKLQAEIKALPELSEGLEALRALRELEKPKDVEATIQNVRLDGKRAGFYGNGMEQSKAIAYTETGFRQMVDFVRPPKVMGVAGTLLALSPSARAVAFNDLAERSIRKDSKPVVLRTWLTGLNTPQARRTLRAVVSQTYSKVDDVDILGMAQLLVPKGAKLRFTRGEARSKLEFIWPMMEREIRVGDPVLGSVSIGHSETKEGGIRVDMQLLRVRCYNFTVGYSTGGDEDIDVQSIRHVGDVKAKLQAVIQKKLNQIEPFVKAFGDAHKVDLPNGETRAQIIERLGRVMELPEATLFRIRDLWDADGDQSAGNTLAGAVNAVTRASQELTMDKADTLERFAGRMVVKGWGALSDDE